MKIGVNKNIKMLCENEQCKNEWVPVRFDQSNFFVPSSEHKRL